MLLHEMIGRRRIGFVGEHGRWPDLFGVELELEEVEEPGHIPGWDIHEDGSLRRGVEYVLAAPSGGQNLEAAIASYFAADVESLSTERASTHIHINATDMTEDTLRSIILIMYVLEASLFVVVGEARKWGGYSMALSEMEPSRITNLMQGTRSKFINAINTGRNVDRYYGLNVSSVQKHGTIEFRYFPGNPSQEELESWLDFVLAVKRAASKYTVTQIIDSVNSPEDWLAFMREIVPEEWFVKLERAVPAADMYDSFNTISAMTVANTNPDSRREPLVFLNEALLKFAMSRLVGEEGAAYLKRISEELQVVTDSEWRWHLSRAMSDGNDDFQYPPYPTRRASSIFNIDESTLAALRVPPDTYVPIPSPYLSDTGTVSEDDNYDTDDDVE